MEKLKCLYCGLSITMFSWTYALCPRCHDRIEECFIDSKNNPDTIEVKYEIKELKMYMLGMETSAQAVSFPKVHTLENFGEFTVS